MSDDVDLRHEEQDDLRRAGNLWLASARLTRESDCLYGKLDGLAKVGLSGDVVT